jgi:hypothetical protein
MSAGAADHRELRPEPPTTYYEGVVQIPGHGTPPNRCRDLSPVGFCEAGHTILGRSSCGTRYCPDHWRDWVEQATVAMVARLAAYRQAQPMGPEMRLSHVVASPPQDRDYSVRELWETRSDAYEALEAAGVRGGAAVTHPYRTNDRGDELYRTAKEAGELGDGVGKWKFLRETTEGPEDLSRYVEASPHYHTLAAAEDVDGAAAPEGWVVERVRTFDTFHPRDTDAYRDMARTAYYTLTHGAVQDGRATRTTFGEIHSFSPEEELTAAMWDRIQREAEKAVKASLDDSGGSGSGHTEERECPREECEQAVLELEHLPGRMDDDDWRAGIPRERLARLRGVLVYYEGRADRPPPGAVTSEARLREWLKGLGEVHTPEPTQAQLPRDVFASGGRGEEYVG